MIDGQVRSGVDDGRQAKGQGMRGRRVFFCLIPCLLALLVQLTAVYASGGGGAEGEEGPNWINFAWRLFNFVVLAGALYWLLAEKARAFFAGRREGIKNAVADAVAAREAAENKFREYSEKLDRATEEIDQIGKMIEAQGLAEKKRIVDDARKAAEKIREDTQARMKQEFNAASQQLRIEAVRLSTEMAGELLRRHIQAADHEAMVKDTIEKLGSKN
jgi:F-type H+-transporting ATPase subunit b